MSKSEQEDIDTIRKKAHFLEVINTFASQLLEVNSVNEAVWSVAKHAVAKLGYEDCVVYLLDETDNSLIQSAAHGPKNPIDFDIENPIRLKLGEGICGAVAVSGISEIVSDTTKDPRYRLDDQLRYSEITVPILSNDKVIGVIDSENSKKDFFNEQDLRILETIAAMVSTKISQARAYEVISKHREELKQKVEERTQELKETIVKLRKSNDEIKQSNIEKETLLREIHHRVKNNLQIVTSLLNLSSRNVMDNEVIEIFKDCQNRIKSMAVIHEQLYRKGNLSKIDAQKYIREIGDELFESFNAKNRILVDYQLEELFFDVETSVPFGLILNEIIVNSLKHAFPMGKGAITISLVQKDNIAKLFVRDNGCGFDVNSSTESIGLELIETLTEQMDGHITLSSSATGTSVIISFPQ